MFLSKKFKNMFKFLSKWKNKKEFKSFGATLENVCLPTEKLKPGTW